MSLTEDVFKGLVAFPITPASPDGIVDTEALTRIIERLIVPGIDSIGLLGSTGTYMFLTREQRKRAIVATIQVLQGRKPVIVSAGALRTDDAQRLAKDAEEAGVDGLLLAPVSYTQLTDDEVYTHFESVAGSTTLPICIYNNPSATGFNFSDTLLARIATLPNVIALKQPAPATGSKERHETLCTKLPPGFSVGYSRDWLVTDSLFAGGSAWYSVIAGVLPAPSIALIESIRKGDTAEVRRISASFQPIWDLFKEFSGLRVAFALANEMGLCKSDPPRPILPIADSLRGRVQAALAQVEESV